MADTQHLRIAIFSDVHGNCLALDAVIEDFRRREITTSICLGDAVQGGLQPREVLERLDRLGCPVILGNSDDFLVTSVSEREAVSPETREIAEWSREQIGAEGLDLIRSFHRTHEHALDQGRALLCFHGGPRSHSDVMLPESSDEEVAEILGETEALWLAGGHTHVQWLRTLRDGRVFFNPGSAGAAYNRNMELDEFYFYPIAQYAVISASPSDITIEFCQVPFDAEELGRIAQKSSHPNAHKESRRFKPKGAS